MRTILLVFSLIALAAPSYAAQRSSLEKECRALVGREEPEGTDGKSHMGQRQRATLQRLLDGRHTVGSATFGLRGCRTTKASSENAPAGR